MRITPLWLALVAGLAIASPARARDATYLVVSGDTLEGIARRYLAPTRTWRDLAIRNRVTNPRLLMPGKVVYLPVEWLRRVPLAARLTSYTGEVQVVQGGQALGVRTGMPLVTPSLVRTSERSFATISLPDGSMLSVLPSTTLKLTQLSQVVLTGSVLREFEVPQGRVQSSVTPAQGPDDSYRIRTPLAVASVRGTSFRTVAAAGEQFSRVEVLEGQVAVTGKGDRLLTPGQGVMAGIEGLGAPRDLLGAPRLVNPGLLQEGERLKFTLSPEPGAVQYHLILAADAGFVEQIDEAITDGSEADFAGLANGIYFVRVSALSPEGFEGLSRDYSFRRERYSFAASLEVDRKARKPTYRFRWQAAPGEKGNFRFQMRRAEEPSVPVVDLPGLEQTSISLSALPPGDYVWRVGRWVKEDGRHVMKWDNERELVVTR